MVYFNWFYWIAGFGLFATILIVTVSVVCWCWTDPDTPPPFDWPGGADGNPETPYPMAKGGIVTRPTNALIGEAGPEAVIPLSRPNAVGMGNHD